MKEYTGKTVNRKRLWIIEIFLIMVMGVLILTPYFLNVNFEGNDTVFHYRCIEVMSRYSLSDIVKGMIFKDEILHGMLMDNFTGNTGYGAGIFYPPLSHAAVVVVYKLIGFTGISLMACYRITGIICMCLSGIMIYLLGRMLIAGKVSKRENDEKLIINPAFLSSIIYMTALYHISDHMSRDAIAECWIFVFIPILFMSVLFLIRDNYPMFVLTFVISCVGLIHSHLVMTVYTVLFFGIAMLISFKEIFLYNTVIKDEYNNSNSVKFFKKHLIKRILYVAAGLIITCLISLPFFVRLIINRRGASYYVFDGNMTTVDLLNRNRMSLLDFFVGMKNGNIAVHSNLILLALVIFALFVYFYPGKNQKLIGLKGIMKSTPEKRILFISGAFFFILSGILSSQLIDWRFMPHFLQIIQFPWRLLVFQVFGMTVMAAVFIISLAGLYESTGEAVEESVPEGMEIGENIKITPKRIILILFISCIAYTLIEQISNYMLIYDRDYREYLNVYDYDDYLPMNSVGKYIDEIDTDCVYWCSSGEKSDGDIGDGINEGTDKSIITADISENEMISFKLSDSLKEKDNEKLDESLLYIEVPRLYYQGYTIEVVDNANSNEAGIGQKRTIEYHETEKGFLGINFPPGSVVTVRYTGTDAEIIANRISLVAIIVFMVYCILGFLYNHKTRNVMKNKSTTTKVINMIMQ